MPLLHGHILGSPFLGTPCPGIPWAPSGQALPAWTPPGTLSGPSGPHRSSISGQLSGHPSPAQAPPWVSPGIPSPACPPHPGSVSPPSPLQPPMGSLGWAGGLCCSFLGCLPPCSTARASEKGILAQSSLPAASPSPRNKKTPSSPAPGVGLSLSCGHCPGMDSDPQHQLQALIMYLESLM